jgi:hypothetical protein
VGEVDRGVVERKVSTLVGPPMFWIWSGVPEQVSGLPEASWQLLPDVLIDRVSPAGTLTENEKVKVALVRVVSTVPVERVASEGSRMWVVNVTEDSTELNWSTRTLLERDWSWKAEAVPRVLGLRTDSWKVNEGTTPSATNPTKVNTLPTKVQLLVSRNPAGRLGQAHPLLQSPCIKANSAGKVSLNEPEANLDANPTVNVMMLVVLI